jgi:hypothetical protein
MILGYSRFKLRCSQGAIQSGEFRKFKVRELSHIIVQHTYDDQLPNFWILLHSYPLIKVHFNILTLGNPLFRAVRSVDVGYMCRY